LHSPLVLPKLREQREKENMTVIKKADWAGTDKTDLEHIISHRSYVFEGIPVSMMNKGFLANADLLAVAVLDEENRFSGYLSRHDWFEKMAAWKDKNKEVEATLDYFLQPCLMLPHTTNPFDIWGKGEWDDLSEEFWFSVVNKEEKFIGLFSSSDLLSYFLNISRSELTLARKIQGRLNRKVHSGKDSSFDVEFLSLPAKDIGGDLVYSIPLSQNKTLFALIDVSGKGHAAALVTGMIYGILSLAGINTKLERLINVINRVIYRTFNNEIFATAVIGIIDEEDFHIRLADMGHSHFYFTPSPFPNALSQGVNYPLGIEEELNPPPEILEIPMKGGEELLIVSDGILEQENKIGIPYDINKILHIMAKNKKNSLENTINLIQDDFRDFLEQKVQHDDASVMIVRRN
jgi:hypothetical protein